MKDLTAEDILKDDSASYWLKDNIRLALGINTGITETKRDIVDMINDAEVLVTVLDKMRLSPEEVEKNKGSYRDRFIKEYEEGKYK